MRELSVPPVTTMPDETNLTDPVWRNADEEPELAQFARRTTEGWREVTAAEFRDQVTRLACGFIAAGIGVGDRVALMSRTRYEWTLFDYAIWAAGGVVVPIYETSSPEQVEWILSDSGAIGCVAETAAHAELIGELRDRLPELGQLWQIEPGPVKAGAVEAAAVKTGAVETLTAEGEAVSEDNAEQRRRSRRADDVATLIYTSGTTGRPKGCVLTHRNLASCIGNAIPGLRSMFHQGASTLLFLPLAHAFARMIQLGAVEGRATLAHTADIQNLLPDLASFQPTFLLSVPRVFEKVYNTARQRAHADGRGSIFDRAERTAIEYSRALDAGGPGPALRLRHKLFDKLVYSRLRAALGGRCEHAISGGAPLGTRLAHFFRGIGITVYEGYGLTETSPATNVNSEDAIRIGTVGRPLPGVTERIAEDGEILVKGDLVFDGYWHNETATAEAIDADGWLHTGDIGALDDEGYLSITGRKKELIVTAGGKNVAPAVLEDRARAHPLVSQCVVVGDGRPFVAALVTLDPELLADWAGRHDAPADPAVARDDERVRAQVQEAVDEANRAVSRAEQIREFRILPADFTVTGGQLTPSLKVRRNEVMKEYADEIASIYG